MHELYYLIDYFMFEYANNNNLRLAFPLIKCSTRRNVLPTESSNHGTLSHHM